MSLLKDLTARVLSAVESAFPAALAAIKQIRAAQETQAWSTQSATTQPDMWNQVEDSLFTKKVHRTLIWDSYSAYEQFRSTAGHFFRMSIGLDLVNKTKFCMKGGLFRFICYLKSATTFIAYFQLRAAASSVGAKGRHLQRLALYGITLITRKNEKLRSKAAAVSEFLRNASASYNRVSSQEARRKDLKEGIRRITMLLPKDFIRFLNSAGKELF